MPAPTDDGVSIFRTLEAFQSGITTTLSPAGGANAADGWAAKIEAADGWAAKIEAADRPDLTGIAGGLRRLADALRAEPFDAARVAPLLKEVGAHTAEAARTEPEAHLVGPLRQLAELVTAAGEALGGRPPEIAGVSTDLPG